MTAEVRATGAEDTVVEAEGMTDTTEGTGVHVGDKGIHPTPTTTKTDIESSTVSRPTATEVGWDECLLRVKQMGG